MWVDDLAFPVFAPAPSLMAQVKTAFGCIYTSFVTYGLELNMKPNKTAVLPVFFGPRCDGARRAFGQLTNHSLPCPHRGGIVLLPVVAKYVHMGKVAAASSALMPEINARHGSAQPVFRRLSITVFKKTRIAVATKLNMAGALLLSREMFSCGCSGILRRKKANFIATSCRFTGRRAARGIATLSR